MAELFGRTRRSVTHMELRDDYGDGGPGYRAWREGVPMDEIARFDPVGPWVTLVRAHVSRGVSFRRARIISEPVSEYIRFEHAATPHSNLAAGERVRWLPRPRAADLALPGCDFWQFDDGLVCFVYQSGDGNPAGYDLVDDAAVAELCASAFEAVWERALDHAEYSPA
ncbi:hypothetical protein DQ384_29250 [Sphaerisporangium album]|uniref:DUF6879 domain-containing protein n=1 Tax=Sphaerisporangium album TaxID=509200 RepID=A0A367FA77_9ACTN|nr:DUF6879 family protein [Sphaerisporangium album]RCG26597.1 hypothetical protein DQ384_29250 [Sphaerisporangium album]